MIWESNKLILYNFNHLSIFVYIYVQKILLLHEFVVLLLIWYKSVDVHEHPLIVSYPYKHQIWHLGEKADQINRTRNNFFLLILMSSSSNSHVSNLNLHLSKRNVTPKYRHPYHCMFPSRNKKIDEVEARHFKFL